MLLLKSFIQFKTTTYFYTVLKYFKANKNGDESTTNAALLLSKAEYLSKKANNENPNEP